VVATGMDGASIAAIEPKAAAPVAQPTYAPPIARTAPPAPPVLTPRPAPMVEPLRSAAAQAQAQPQAYSPPPVQPRPEPVFEPAAARYQPEELDLPLEAPAPVIEPQIIAPRTSQALEDAEFTPVSEHPSEEPLFPQVHYGEDRERKGFFSLFGRGRQDEPPPIRDYRNDPTPVLNARAQAAAPPVQTPPAQPAPEAAEDLEIPSFLRRLAN